MTYTVKPETREGCDCDDCKAGRHIYSLYRKVGAGWQWAATSLQTYSSEEDARNHDWGIVFGPRAVWEDGTPIPEPEPIPKNTRKHGGVRMVALNTKALARSADLLRRHWRAR